MKSFKGHSLGWNFHDSVIELTLNREPANEIGLAMLEELELFAAALENLSSEASVCIIAGALKPGFSAGADLRELYKRSLSLDADDRLTGVRGFIERIHRVFNTLDSAPLVTIAAVHGVCFGGGFELALTCDLIVADKMARFAFPELRLGLIPGFGGIPRLKRDAGNAFVRDLLLTGRSINAARAHAAGLVSQLAGEGQVLRIARGTAAQIAKFDAATRMAAKKFIKPIPHDEIRREADLFCELFSRPAVMVALKKFAESTDALPYLP
jgi:enoyl-CoA hydratase/carnithine racemase